MEGNTILHAAPQYVVGYEYDDGVQTDEHVLVSRLRPKYPVMKNAETYPLWDLGFFCGCLRR